VTPAKPKLLMKLFQHHEQQLLQEVRTKATGPRSIFARQLILTQTAADDEAYRAVNMTAEKRLQFQNRLSDAVTEAPTWSLADAEHITIQLDREIYGITSNKQMQSKKEFSIHMMIFEAWWQTIGIHALWETIEQHVIHFRYSEGHHVSEISESIRRMGSGDNSTTDISERLHIANVKEVYQSSNKVHYIRQMLKHNDRCTGLDYTKETLSYLALEDWYNVDSAKVFNPLSATDIH